MILDQQGNNNLPINGFIADQSPLKSKYWTIFLNQESAFFLGAEKVARKQNSTVLFADMRKTGRGHYSVKFVKICDDASLTDECEITRAYVRMLEKIIVEKPEYWLWSHQRWKRKRPSNIPLN